MIELRQLSTNDGRDVYTLLQAIPKDENGFQNACQGLSYEEYRQWLVTCDRMARGIGLVEWMVPQINYWLYVDGTPVGMGKLRTRLTDKLRVDGGHCGYSIVAAQRNKGYGKALLSSLIKEAERLGIPRVLLTVHQENEASKKTALRSGGVIEKTADGKHYIWIECQACR